MGGPIGIHATDHLNLSSSTLDLLLNFHNALAPRSPLPAEQDRSANLTLHQLWQPFGFRQDFRWKANTQPVRHFRVHNQFLNRNVPKREVPRILPQ